MHLIRELLLAGEEIARSNSRERNGKCYSYVCDSTCKRPTRTEKTCEHVPPPAEPTTPPTETVCACHHQGKAYRAGEEIARSDSREKDGKCYRYVCDSTCKKTKRIEKACEPPTKITTPPTIKECACHHEGRAYLPGEEIARSNSRERDGKCYSYVCDSTCKRPTRTEKTCEHVPPPAEPTTPPTETVCACHHQGKAYRAGEEIARSDSREKDGKCYRYVCDSTCKKTKRIEKACEPPTKITTPPTIKECACHHEGRAYLPGEEIARSNSRERDGKCYSYVCDSTCKRPTRTEKTCEHVPPPAEPTTPPTETVCACHHQGKAYRAGEEIARSDSREKDGKCYRYVCDSTCKKTKRIEKACEPPSKYLPLNKRQVNTEGDFKILI
ncbi:uncharacterized protein LOC121402880 [Xenopus laevis]|uniref:Uncharacterized protein LOC121402880 n=1 Tax=Xenopus laevis TaxID=8355 RepID=A0A8J1MUL5_XENLA|nr:uncharacterized protein LOC121402880 [Xenopus laevis]